MKFSEEAIIDSDIALVHSRSGKTNALMLTVLITYPDEVGPDHGQKALEIMLTREELHKVIAELEEDWDAFQSLQISKK